MVLDNRRIDAPSGVVRAFDARTGALRWAWDPVPPAAAPAPRERSARRGATARGTANAWSDALGRPAARASSTCRPATPRPTTTAASATASTTTRARWSRCAPTPARWPGTSRPCTTTSGTTTCPRSPCSSTCPAPDGPVPALAQATKMGQLFLLDRRTRRAALPGRGAARAAGRRARRDALADAALPDRGRRRSSRHAHARRRLRLHALGPRRAAASRSRRCAPTASSRRRRSRARSSTRAWPAARTGAASRRPAARMLVREHAARRRDDPARAARGVRRAVPATDRRVRLRAAGAARPTRSSACRCSRRSARPATRRRGARSRRGPRDRRDRSGRSRSAPRATWRRSRSGCRARHVVAEPRRPDHDRGRPHLHRRDHRPLPARLRHRDAARSSGAGACRQAATRRR